MVLPSTTASSGSTPAQAEDRLLQSTQARIANRNFMAPLPTAAPADGGLVFLIVGFKSPQADATQNWAWRRGQIECTLCTNDIAGLQAKSLLPARGRSQGRSASAALDRKRDPTSSCDRRPG